MYSARQSRYQQQIYQGINLDQGSDAASTIPLNPTQNSRQESQQQQQQQQQQQHRHQQQQQYLNEEAANTPVYKRIVFTQSKGLSFLKRLQWKRFPEPVRKQMRRILESNYRLTLDHIAGSTANSVNYEIETALTQVAKRVDNSLKIHLIPGNFDTNLLNSTLPDAIVQSKEKFAALSKKVAKDVILMERRRLIMEQEMEEADKSKEIEEKKRKLENCSIKEDLEPKSIDYVQSLMRFPSSDIFEPLT